MKINYCLPIVESSMEQIEQILKNQSANFSYFEIWLDYIRELDPEFPVQISSAYGNKLIFLFRRQKLDAPLMPAKVRTDILTSLSGSDSLVDLDINDQAAELHLSLENHLKVKLICSYHNYTRTPSDEELREIILKMDSYSPEIYKIACNCKEQSDSLRLMKLLLHLKSEDKKFVVLGMGEKSLITRLFGTKWGNEMLFAPTDISKSTAVGQYTKDKYERIFKLLK
jgi:3-dehydroquinate dehydratase-1